LYKSLLQDIWLADDDIDDQEIFIDAVKQILPLAAISVFINGEKLMAALNAGKKPDILFLDINMPCKDGLDCLKEIRANAANEKLPIIIYSSSVQPKHIDESYSLGASLYYKKPSSFQEFIKGLSSLLCMNWSDPYTITSAHYINNRFVAFGDHQNSNGFLNS